MRLAPMLASVGALINFRRGLFTPPSLEGVAFMRRTVLLLSTMVVALLLASGVALAATFTNTSPIQIVDDGPANPYPSQINVQNLSGNITDVDLKLSGYSHVFPDDVGVLVVGPQGQKVLVMSDVGFTCDVSGIDLTFDDEATSSLPDGCAITAGTYKPTQGTAQSGEGSHIDANFPSPAPAGPYGTQLSVFDGTEPNGTWSLYVLDDTDVETGQIANGWSLEITTDANQEPTAADDSYTTNEDTTLTEAAPGVLTNDEDADGDPLTADLVENVDNGTLTLNSDGSFTYTPNANFNGTDTFTYKASDGTEDSNIATVSITVTAVNDAPTCDDLALQTEEDTEGSASPECSDVEGDTLAYRIASQPDHGSASVQDGRLVYDPNPNYDGTDSFTYRASDGSLASNVATVSINVSAVNDAPTVEVAAGGECGTNDRSGQINLTVNDPDGRTPTESLMLSATSNNTTLVPASNVTFGGSGPRRTMSLSALDGNSGTALVRITVSDGSLKSTKVLTVKVGTNKADAINGASRADALFGLDAVDALNGLGGNDLLCGGKGVDALNGGNGDDTLFGGPGKDVLKGGSGADHLFGGSGNDGLYGDNGADRLGGGAGADRFSGGAGEDAATDFDAAEGDTRRGIENF
jgi:VCBS repeat-containing protein